MNKLKLLIISSRPVFWPVFFFICLLGVIASGNWTLSGWVSLFYVTWPMGLVILSINDIADRDSDLKNHRKGSWQGNIVSDSDIPFLIYSLIITTLLFTAIFYYLQNYLAAVLILLAPLLSYAYSCKPLRFKGRPFLDSLINGVGILLVYLLGFSHNNPVNLLKLPIVVWAIILGFIAAHAMTALVDYDVDKSLQDNTTAVFLGKKMTALYCAMILMVVLIIIPFNVAVLTYLLICIGFNITLLGNPTKNYILSGAWFLVFGFCLMSLYLFLFDYNYIVRITSS